MNKHIKDTKDMVEFCLKTYPQTRNSDISLTIQIWKDFYQTRIKKMYGTKECVLLEDLFDLPREDNVKRIRAKFNEEGLYLPTSEEVAKRRNMNIPEWREAMGYAVDKSTKGVLGI